jgi:hypothetical protein
MSSKKGRKFLKDRQRIEFREDDAPVMRYAKTRLPAIRTMREYGQIRARARNACAS